MTEQQINERAGVFALSHVFTDWNGLEYNRVLSILQNQEDSWEPFSYPGIEVYSIYEDQPAERLLSELTSLQHSASELLREVKGA